MLSLLALPYNSHYHGWLLSLLSVRIPSLRHAVINLFSGKKIKKSFGNKGLKRKKELRQRFFSKFLVIEIWLWMDIRSFREILQVEILMKPTNCFLFLQLDQKFPLEMNCFYWV